MLIKLPNGLLDGQDHFRFAEIDELRGKQQNYLVDKDLVVGNIGHVPRILEDMILSLQTEQGLKWKGKISDAVHKLTAGDLETVLIKVRENTYGPRFYHEAQCPHCEAKNKNLRLDLDKLEIDEMPVEEMIKDKKVELPKSKMIVELKPLYMNDLFEILKITDKKQKTLITSLLTVSMKSLAVPVDTKAESIEYDVKDRINEKDTETIPASDLMYLQDKVKDFKLEGGIDTTVEVTCSECSKDFSFKLNVYEPGFFDPTKGSQS